MTRTFIGIPVPPAASTRLWQLVSPLLQSLGNTVRQTLPENWHLTIRFLGNVEASALEQIGQSILEITRDFKKFRININKVSGFPSLNSRIISAHVEKHPCLDKLFSSLDKVARQLGVPSENRGFRPHITLAKSREPIQIEPMTIEPFSITVEKLVLFESRPSDSGSHYIPLKVASFT